MARAKYILGVGQQGCVSLELWAILGLGMSSLVPKVGHPVSSTLNPV